MTTLIEHIDRLDAQIDGCGFYTLNKEMATSVIYNFFINLLIGEFHVRVCL